MKYFARSLFFLKIVFIVLCAYLTYLLLIELAPEPMKYEYQDKIQHVVAFCGVAMFGLLGFPSMRWWIVAGMAGYGALMEVMQKLLTTTRHASITDWFADVAGILLAWVLVWLWLDLGKRLRGRV